MKTRLKKYLNKHKNRIFSLIAVMVFIPLFSISSFAYTIPIDSVAIAPNYDSYTVVIPMSNSGDAISSETHYDFANNYIDFNLSRAVNDIQYIKYVYATGFTYTFNHDLYDYYVTVNLFYKENTSTLNIGDVTLLYRQPFSASEVNFDLDTISTSKINVGNGNISQIISKVSDDFNSTIWGFLLWGSGNISGGSKSFTAYLHQVPKDTSTESVLSLISAINNQTSTLGGKIDDTNDFINNGNSSTGGIVSDNNSAVDNLNEVVSEYHATEQQFFDDFTANQQAINSDIVGWSWGGLVNCANWVGDTMTDYYNNMGDFRQYIIYPLMLGIVLFFLGRGGAIIGHLFRKPTQSTVNIESTSFKRGNTRYTTTTTSKRGGVFRK